MIAEYYDPDELLGETWVGSQFVLWEAKLNSTAKGRRDELARKARYIALDTECLSNLMYTARIFMGIEDFEDIEAEVAAAFLRRSSFSEAEAALAWEILTTKAYVSPRLFWKVLVRTWEQDGLDQALIYLGKSNPKRAQMLRKTFAACEKGEDPYL
jgi:hypothetical protein